MQARENRDSSAGGGMRRDTSAKEGRQRERGERAAYLEGVGSDKRQMKRPTEGSSVAWR